MAAPPTQAADPTPTFKPPKVRSSCEDCGNAKVKCDRGKPACRRCITLGLACAYSISRKSGKPSRKRPVAQLEKINGFSCKKRAGGRGNYQVMGFEPPPDVDRQIQLDFVADSLHVPPSINSSSNTRHQNQAGSPFITPFSINEWPQLDLWSPSLEFPYLSKNSNLGNPGATFDKPDSHSCPRGSYELFRDLICPGPFLHAPEKDSETVAAQLDQVLHFNRAAIERLARLLKCPCAKSGHRVMVHASIVSRILIWYQQAAGWTGGPSGEVKPSTVTASSSDSASPTLSPPTTDAETTISPMLVQSTGFAVTQVSISMGSFDIDNQDLQSAIRAQLVLSELKKMATLIDRFVSQDCGDSGVENLYTHLGVWLRGEYLKTVGTLRARLGALNERLEL